MADIIKAIEKEKEYLSYRMKNEEPFHLADAVKECGFESLDEYFNAKKEYEFNQLNFEFIIKEPSNCIAEGLRLLDTQTTAIVFVDCDETFVYSGESKPFNEDYCKDNNIPIYPLHTTGGAIVGVQGDFSIGICVPESVGCDSGFMMQKVQELLSTNTDGIAIDGNDILYNGNKICAVTGYNKNGMYLFIAHFSFSDRIDLISEVCTVPTETSTFSLRRNSVYKPDKIPAYIDFMTREQLRQEVLAWLKPLTI